MAVAIGTGKLQMKTPDGWVNLGECGPETITFPSAQDTTLTWHAFGHTDTIHIKGTFANLGTASNGSDYIAKWTGTNWNTVDHPLSRRCPCCGGTMFRDYACVQCGKPTPQWWANLRKMTGTN